MTTECKPDALGGLWTSYSWNRVNAKDRMEKMRRKQRQRDVTVHRHSQSNLIKPCLKLNFLGMFSYINLESPFSFEANLSRLSVRSNRKSNRNLPLLCSTSGSFSLLLWLGCFSLCLLGHVLSQPRELRSPSAPSPRIPVIV